LDQFGALHWKINQDNNLKKGIPSVQGIT